MERANGLRYYREVDIRFVRQNQQLLSEGSHALRFGKQLLEQDVSYKGEHGRAEICAKMLAVRVGFEPTEPVKVQRFSRPPDSTTLAPHLLLSL